MSASETPWAWSQLAKAAAPAVQQACQTRITPSISGVVASPTKLSTTTASSGPVITNRRGRQRSASAPKPSCDTEFASWKHIASVPAVASDRFKCGISNGSRGA